MSAAVPELTVSPAGAAERPDVGRRETTDADYLDRLRGHRCDVPVCKHLVLAEHAIYGTPR